jgi:AcrR family transcriptional regulator
MPAAEVARHQRARLEGAMVEAVARHGFAGTTLRELVTLAGVSKTTFYEHFDSKQDCFLATFDEIVAQATVRVSAAYREGGDFRGRLLAGLTSFMELAVEEPAAAALAGVESLTLGAAGVAHRERGSEAFALMIAQSFEHSPSPIEVSPLIVRAIVGGIRGVVYHRLRAGRVEDLPGLAEELVDWALRYQREPSAAMVAAAERAARPATAAPAGEAEAALVPWDEPPDSRRSRAELSQRERIVRGAARVVVERSYEALSIPAISAAAGVSNQTFYEFFDGKRAAFLAAFEIYSAEALRVAAGAFAAEGDRAEAVGAGLRALVDYVAEHHLFASLAFFELPTAGPVALDKADQTLETFMAYLRPGIAPRSIGGPVSDVVMEAIATGTWAVLQYEIAHGRRDSLPEIAPQLTEIALAPFATGPGA